MKIRILAVVCLAVLTTSAGAQRRLHFDLDYHYYLGLSQRFFGQSYGRGDIDHLYGNSLRFAIRYDITQKMSAGAGIGIDWYQGADYATAPLYATFRYKLVPDKSFFKGLYGFTNLGYSLGDSDGDPFLRGVMFDLGVGWPVMLTKNFGINLQVGYNLSRFKNLHSTFFVFWPDGNIGMQDLTTDGFTHSLSFGLGFTF